MSLDINNAGCEFVKSVLKLYRSAKYFREKEILAHKLLDAAVEAGSDITELCFCDESKEDEIAKRALKELSRAMFVLKVMSDEGVYPKRRVEPVIALSREVKELIEPYLNAEKPLPPEPASGTAVPLIEEENKFRISEDVDGFNEIYTGDYK